MIAGGLSRRHVAVVALLTLFAVARGGYWAVAMITPSPIDEVQHFDYVRSIARGEGIPTVGEDRVGDEVLRYAKSSPTFFLRSFPYPGDVSAQVWLDAPAAQSYEGIQGPTYYALLSPFYWLGRPGGTAGSWLMVRMGSVLLGALAIPLAWLLTRRLVPHLPHAWLLPPVLLTALNGLNAGSATIGNDVIVLTGSAAAAVLLLRSLEHRTVPSALAAGVLAGLTFVGKSTALALVPVLGLLAVPFLARWWRDDGAAPVLRWVTAYGVAFVAPLLAWFAWNIHAYQALSGAEAAEEITGSLQTTYAASVETVQTQWHSIRSGFWTAQLAEVLPRYQHLWEITATTFVVVGLAVAWRRHGRSVESGAIAWGGAAYPIAFLAITALFLVAVGESGLLLGRYLWVALVPVLVAVGIAIAVVGGARAGPVLALVLVAASCWVERDIVERVLARDYEQGLAGGGLAPVIEQSWQDGYAAPTSIAIEVGCPTEVLDLGLEEPPEQIHVRTSRGTVTGELISSTLASFARYQLERPVRGDIEIPVRTGVAVSGGELEPAGTLVGARGDPMLRVHCPAASPEAVRFDQLYGPGHPPVSRDVLLAWPTGWAWASTLAAGAIAFARLSDLARSRRLGGRRSASGDDADAVS